MELQRLTHDDVVVWAVFSPDGTKVATATADKRRESGTPPPAKPCPPLQHDDAVEHVAFSPDGSQVVTESKDHTARLWDATTGQELKKVTIVPDGP